MNGLDSLITDLLAAQAEEAAHRSAADAAIVAMERAGQRALQLGAQLLEVRGGSSPFIYAGRLYTFQGSRVTGVAVETVTLGTPSTEEPAQGGGEVGND